MASTYMYGCMRWRAGRSARSIDKGPVRLPAGPTRPPCEVGASLPDQLNAVRFFWSNYAYARRVVYIT
jgi:hypothetical protein